MKISTYSQLLELVEASSPPRVLYWVKHELSLKKVKSVVVDDGSAGRLRMCEWIARGDLRPVLMNGLSGASDPGILALPRDYFGPDAWCRHTSVDGCFYFQVVSVDEEDPSSGCLRGRDTPVRPNWEDSRRDDGEGELRPPGHFSLRP